MPHVASRIQSFLDPASGDTFNIDIATESFMRGGWFGRGPGEGTVKRLLPESHTDFVFAVAAEEFGVALCLVLVALYAFIVIRALVRALRNDDAFTRFAAAGLAILFGTQSAINMAVNLHLIPAKGMTLPFISYGGSSMISLAYAMGMLLALTREQPRSAMLTAPDLAGAGSSGVTQNGAAPLVLLAAGGTGGHLFPAEALAVALQTRGVTIDLATDARAVHFQFPAREVHLIPSATVRGGNPLALARTAALLALGTAKAWALIGRIQPRVVVGFGGYPTVPPMLAASLRGVPTLLHEQNAVMGRANRLLAGRVTAIATGFPTLARLDTRLKAKTVFTGNPVRPQVVAAAATPFAMPEKNAPFRFARLWRQPGRAGDGGNRAGGAGKARFGFSRASVARAAGARRRPRRRAPRLCAHRRRRRMRAVFPDLPQRLAAAHLVVSRSGASTVAELSAIGRPAILVPLPHALDQDQLANAGVLEAAGGAIRIVQQDFTPERLATEITALAGDPARLVGMAAAAKSTGTVDAAERLADLVMKVAQ